jgi:hypothetical protein
MSKPARKKEEEGLSKEKKKQHWVLKRVPAPLEWSKGMAILLTKKPRRKSGHPDIKNQRSSLQGGVLFQQGAGWL